MSRTLLHISDLHFGRIEPGLPEALIRESREIGPDVVAVSGDLTQRARTLEFIAAREFLDRLPAPWVVVPGNHDVPLDNLYGRFLHSLDRFRRYIEADLSPSYTDREIAVFGINTARALTWKGGRLAREQIEETRNLLCALNPEVTRVVVTHHPFDVPAGIAEHNMVGSARAAFERWAACGADLLLCGHLHLADATTTLNRFGGGNPHAIVVTAGTATSTRGRGARNSFNVIRVENRRAIEVARWCWDPESHTYLQGDAAGFERGSAGWTRTSGALSAAMVLSHY